MKKSVILLPGLAFCLTSPVMNAQEAQPEAPAVAGQDAVDAAVEAYHTLQMYRTYIATAEMLDDAAYDNDVVAGARKLLEIAESMPMDALPADYKAYLEAKNARQRKSIEQIEAIMAGRTEEELTAKDLVKLKKVMNESERELKEISRRYPEAEAKLGDEASQAFAQKLSEKLQLDEKAKQFLLEHPEVAAGGQEAALSASMRQTAEEIRKYMESK